MPTNASRALERWTRHRFPMVEGIEYRWSGEVMEPLDGLAFIGRNPMDNEQRLHRHRRFRQRHDAWNHRREYCSPI